MRGNTLLGEGEKENPNKNGDFPVALSWRRRAAFWGNAANVLFAPSPSRVFPRAPFPLNPLPLVDFSCGCVGIALRLFQRGRGGGVRFVGVWRDRAEG